jgi:hypothetical protein
LFGTSVGAGELVIPMTAGGERCCAQAEAAADGAKGFCISRA